MASKCMKYPTSSHKCGACHTIKAQDGWEFSSCRLLKNKPCFSIKDDECPRFNDNEYWENLSRVRKENNQWLI